MPDLLVELFSEEIPARMQRRAAEDLKTLVTNQLISDNLTYEAASAHWTPRRLCLDIRGLSAQSQPRFEERKGPSIHAPQKAIDGFLQANGLKNTNEAIIVTGSKKTDYYIARIVHPSRNASDIVASIMPNIIHGFPWPKSMRWGIQSQQAGALRWVRPLQNILCVLSYEQGESAVVPFEVAGLVSNNLTYGHRFLSSGLPIKVRCFDDYSAQLEAAYVILNAERRKNILVQDAETLCFAQGLDLVEDEALAEEIAGLVEWPIVLMGRFDQEFLTIPPEIIQRTIKINQKCFVTRKRGETTSLAPYFIPVANISATDGGKTIAEGNEKVVRARLSDALYFWQTDQKSLPDLAPLQIYAQPFGLDLSKPLDQRMAKLAHLDVTFHAKLGSQGARVLRIKRLSALIAPMLGADIHLAQRAACLAKADLQTEIVGEFPELQGLMGYKYALLQGEKTEVAVAIKDHYKPQGPHDHLPSHPIATTVALADKIDILVGFWLINEKPTGSKDPYALRRAALGVIRLLLSSNSPISLKLLLTASALEIRNTCQNLVIHLAPEDAQNAVLDDLLSFIHERFKIYLKEEGARYDAIEALLTPNADDLLAVARRLEALIVFINQDQGKNFVNGLKRIHNILEAESKKGSLTDDPISETRLTIAGELTLYRALNGLRSPLEKHLSTQDFSAALQSLTELTRPIDEFFSQVLVNDENTATRNNRLALLKEVRALSLLVADFTKLAL
ncbi:glycine--tRNA ligase subunit beta [Bartonella sp. DGB2]|uniref:glycine--tRNA ligase subunit beta n=1 Tax=Bartonella sp. DGB2 TaxID=3388426 RepID=UPI00398FA843